MLDENNARQHHALDQSALETHASLSSTLGTTSLSKSGRVSFECPLFIRWLEAPRRDMSIVRRLLTTTTIVACAFRDSSTDTLASISQSSSSSLQVIVLPYMHQVHKCCLLETFLGVSFRVLTLTALSQFSWVVEKTKKRAWPPGSSTAEAISGASLEERVCRAADRPSFSCARFSSFSIFGRFICIRFSRVINFTFTCGSKPSMIPPVRL